MGDFSEKGNVYKYKIVYFVILFLSFIWCSLFMSVPFLAEGNFFCRKLTGFIFLFFSPICHQDPGRSFHLMGHPLAVCSRCSGIYIGFLLGVAVYPFLRRFNRKPPPPRWVLVVGILLTVFEFLLSRCGIINSDLFFRSLAGLILGSVTAFYVIPAIFQLVDFHHKE